ncbi:low affinity immunoglobulin epsilon Fc receptor-like isoform X2 [Maylandia zebra]|uniref:low affinity immunoglobulin epsilon Fc receptor-like isoform X2 n=1 Tax=Maylandia zebra TaxID=106582 RepID=UPI00403C81EB
MSSIIDEDPELSMNVKYSKGEDRGERLEGLVLLHENVDSCTDRQVHVSTQDGEIKAQKKLPAVKRSRFRAVEVKLVVLYLLILAGITTRYILVSLEKEQLKDEMEEKCPDRWTRFGSSCYFKSTEAKHWQESRRACQDKGADLVMINSKEEQEFVNELNMVDSWIGLRANQTSGGYKWEWVDGSALTQTFWAEGWSDPYSGHYGVCCDGDGRWTKSYSDLKTFICEK